MGLDPRSVSIQAIRSAPGYAKLTGKRMTQLILLPAARDPYDELPYASRPIEWSAPERLALASLLHGGPRPHTGHYRVLELGVGDGSNLLPLAYYRRDAHFVGVDSCASAIEVARRRGAELRLTNVHFIHNDFAGAARELEGEFAFILAHGVFSWIRDQERDALLALCRRLLAPSGLLYLNYNSKPGWNVRGMVRDFLRVHTEGRGSLAEQAEAARAIAVKMAAALGAVEHPYARLMEQEYRFVCEGHASYIAHEFLAAENHAYWRREFLAVVQEFGLKYVADADFDRPSGRIPVGLAEQIEAAGLTGQPTEDTIDLLSYRQLHSPILTHAAQPMRPVSPQEFAGLTLASSLEPVAVDGPGPWSFAHESGHEVEVRERPIVDALCKAKPSWPRGLPIEKLFHDVTPHIADLCLLQRYGMINLRVGEPAELTTAEELRAAQCRWGDYATTPLHSYET
jgi:SAM-dependent methyltransferase